MRTPHPAAVPAEWPDAEAPAWFDAPREHGGDGRQQRTRGARAACCLGCLPGRPGRRAQGHRSAAGASAGELPRAAAEPADRYGQAAREDRALKRVSSRAVSRGEQSPGQGAVLQRGLRGQAGWAAGAQRGNGQSLTGSQVEERRALGMAGCCACGAERLTKMGGQIGEVVHGFANHGYL